MKVLKYVKKRQNPLSKAKRFKRDFFEYKKAVEKENGFTPESLKNYALPLNLNLIAIANLINYFLQILLFQDKFSLISRLITVRLSHLFAQS